MPVILHSRTLGPQAHSCIGGHGVIEVDVHNEDSANLPAQALQVVPTEYWQTGTAAVPAMPPYSVRGIKVLVCGRADAQAEDVPQYIDFRLTFSEVELRCPLSFSFFSKSLQQWSPHGLPGAVCSQSFNLLLIGAAGTAKSSFINSALTLLSHSGKFTGVTVVELDSWCNHRFCHMMHQHHVTA